MGHQSWRDRCERWQWWSNRKELEQEVDEELALHLEMRAEQLQRQGHTPAQANEEARRRFGDVPAYRRQMLALRGAQLQRRRRAYLWQEVWQDLRFGLRQQLRRPALPLLIVILMVIGVGVTTAVFSVIKAVLLEPLPYPEPDRLVFLNEDRPGYARIPPSYPNFSDWRDASRSFDRIGGLTPWYFGLANDQGAERVLGVLVTAGTFELLGVEPALGRILRPEEDRPGVPAVVIISHGLWTRRYGADPGVIGSVMRLDGQPHTIIGVMPPGFQVPRLWLLGEREELWTSLAASPATLSMLDTRGTHWMAAIGRLREGVSLALARQEMDLIAANLAEQYPDSNEGAGIKVLPVHTELVGEVDRQLLMLLAGSGLLLLVVCTNVAGLLMARAMARQPEVAMRSALGAGRWRLLRQLLAENLPLCLLGGGLAYLLALLGVSSIRALLPADIPRIDTVQVDGELLVFTLGLALATGLLFSLAPAWVSVRLDRMSVLRGAGSAAALQGTGRQRLRSALVMAQIGIALVLVHAAVLMLSSYHMLIKQDYGFDRDNVLTMQVTLDGSQWQEEGEIRTFYGQVLERLRTLPGVTTAAATSKLPLEGGNNSSLNGADGHDFTRERAPAVEISVVTEGYFRAMGISLLAGRSFSADDDGAAEVLPAVINQRMAEILWPDESPVGKSFSFNSRQHWVVIGVVGDVPQYRAERRAVAEAYLLYSAVSRDTTVSSTALRYLVVGSEVEPVSLAAAARRQVAAVAPDLPVSDLRSTGGILASALAGRRFQTCLIGLFAAVVVLLMASGIFAVMSFFVAERRPELGIRSALGADSSSLIRMVLERSARLTAAGLALGLAGALAASRLTRAMVYGVSPTDPFILAACGAGLVVIAIMGSLIPACRAARVDPVMALRNE